MIATIRCDKCSNRIVYQAGAQTFVRVTGALVFTGQTCKAKCHFCGVEVALPLAIVASRFTMRDRGLDSKAEDL